MDHLDLQERLELQVQVVHQALQDQKEHQVIRGQQDLLVCQVNVEFLDLKEIKEEEVIQA